MNKWRFFIGRRWSMWMLAMALGASLFLVFSPIAAQAQSGNGEARTSAVGPGSNARSAAVDLQQELATKITEPFTVAVAGDLDYNYPFAKLDDPSVQAAIKLIRDANVGFANLEGGTMDAKWNNRELGDDIKAMGFNLLNRANNDSPTMEAMAKTSQLLKERGIIWAGLGMNLNEARAPQYLKTPEGRVGLVGMVSISAAGEGGTSARYASPAGAFGDNGISGMNGLRLTMYQVVSPDQLEVLRKIRDDFRANRMELGLRVPAIPANEPKDRVELVQRGIWYKAGDKPGTLSFTMNSNDEREILRSIRNGKEYADFLIATINSHEDTSPLAREASSEYPPDFLSTLAHEAIDNGADMFVGTGVHVLRGIELYKGKPIFYGMHSFAYQLNPKRAGLNDYLSEGLNPYTTDTTSEELEFRSWGSPGYPGVNSETAMWSMVAACKYDKGQLQEVILHPIELGYETPMSARGIPHVPSPEVAQKILYHVQVLSKPFGTTIDIEGNVGVIHVNAAQIETGNRQ